MGQYDEVVERQRTLLEAEKWADGVDAIHSHRLGSMWYDDRPNDTQDGKYVLDVSFNGGFIKREVYDHNAKLIYEHQFGIRLSGDALIDEFTRKT